MKRLALIFGLALVLVSGPDVLSAGRSSAAEPRRTGPARPRLARLPPGVCRPGAEERDSAPFESAEDGEDRPDEKDPGFGLTGYFELLPLHESGPRLETISTGRLVPGPPRSYSLRLLNSLPQAGPSSPDDRGADDDPAGPANPPVPVASILGRVSRPAREPVRLPDPPAGLVPS